MRTVKAWVCALAVVNLWWGGPAACAQEVPDAPPDEPTEVRLRYHLTRVRSSRGFDACAPGPSLQVSAPLSPRLRLEVAHLTGRGSGSGGCRVSHFDLDVGLGWRLDNPANTGDDQLHRIHAVGQWSISEGRLTLPNQEVIQERDEGAGVGLARRAHPDRSVSYSWRVILHPTFLNSNGRNFAGQRALLAQAAVQVRLGRDGFAEAGYSYRTHKLAQDVDASASEQGPFFGASLRF